VAADVVDRYSNSPLVMERALWLAGDWQYLVMKVPR
jgi:hypothetical protein